MNTQVPDPGDSHPLSLNVIELSLPNPLSFTVRRDDNVVSQLRALWQEVVNTWVGLGKGDSQYSRCFMRSRTLHLTVYALPVMLSVIGQIESLITQADVPGADGAILLKQAQDLVNN